MRRPSFQFYPADWLGNTKLSLCSHAEKGAWIEVLCLMHDADPYGMLRWPLTRIAKATRSPLRDIKALVNNGVLKGSDTLCEPFIYTPFHARQHGEPVTLIAQQPGPIWYSSRMVVDEHIRLQLQRNGGVRNGIKLVSG